MKNPHKNEKFEGGRVRKRLDQHEQQRLNQPPFSYLRMADVDDQGNPITKVGEAAAPWGGKWYIIEDIKLQTVNS